MNLEKQLQEELMRYRSINQYGKKLIQEQEEPVGDAPLEDIPAEEPAGDAVLLFKSPWSLAPELELKLNLSITF